MKFLKVGRVAIITRGRYAGKKVVIIQPQDSGSKSHPFPHALVAGIERYPSKVTRRMSKARQTKRSKVKPFIKTVNYNHLMPTRYTLELEGLKGVVTNDTFKEVSQREEAKKTVKKALEERYQSGKNRWFFTPLLYPEWKKLAAVKFAQKDGSEVPLIVDVSRAAPSATSGFLVTELTDDKIPEHPSPATRLMVSNNDMTRMPAL
ncbi:ribosomal L27e protein family-domain-containing protein [Macrophomina phaseolina]|uniref:Ribosomal L27e protein family-domain-containing protein n=1 Tax=Macrophomina phaseolina TaxID=35725 RepID=A0ABQ8GTV9_9PEZI|nr:ribosomal L27e protein family-domain-containing protein [Macrophomina phaseolina]